MLSMPFPKIGCALHFPPFFARFSFASFEGGERKVVILPIATGTFYSELSRRCAALYLRQRVFSCAVHTRPFIVVASPSFQQSICPRAADHSARYGRKRFPFLHLEHRPRGPEPRSPHLYARL